jgi:hypothetical protein
MAANLVRRRGDATRSEVFERESASRLESTPSPTADQPLGLMVRESRRAIVRAMQVSHSALVNPIVDLPWASLRRNCSQTATILVLLSLAVGCDRNIEPYQAGEEPSQPDLARIFPGRLAGSGAPGEAGAADGQAGRTALPPSRTESGTTGSSAPATSAAPIVGQIELSAELEGVRPEGGVLFVIARAQGARRGPPLAVLRIPSPDFPLSFSIGPDDVMIPTMRFEGNISLTARLDADGNAMTRGEGDISSAVEEPLSPGASGVQLLLSERG